tara:strand:+ start:76 stop:330 length:255 start_codon:yes stop_codon:yes gene_type:complete
MANAAWRNTSLHTGVRTTPNPDGELAEIIGRHLAEVTPLERGRDVESIPLRKFMEVAAITGHRDLRVLQRYTHLRAEDLAKKLG